MAESWNPFFADIAETKVTSKSLNPFDDNETIEKVPRHHSNQNPSEMNVASSNPFEMTATPSNPFTTAVLVTPLLSPDEYTIRHDGDTSDDDLSPEEKPIRPLLFAFN